MKKLDCNFERRRKEFVSQLPEYSIAIIPNKLISIRSNDVEYKYRPDSDFYYLTGFDEPNSICVLVKEKREFTYLLFVEGKEQEKEIWVGEKAGIQGAKSIYKADSAYLITQFDDVLKKIISGMEHIYFPLGKNKELDLKITSLLSESRANVRSGIKTPRAIFDPRDLIHKMRLIKDSYEIDCMKKAADISKNAHVLAMSYAKNGMFEYELEAIIEYKFRKEGAIGPAYPSIVGSGKNCTILHYIKNNKKIQKNDLLLIDAGSEYDYYASDLTRTFPVNKKFNSIQKDIYQIVLEAQTKAIEQIKPGKRFIDSHNKAVGVLVEGLKELRLLKGSIGEIIKKGKYKKFFMHRTGHWLGLDVHDAGPYIDNNGNSIKLVPGMVMTVEPGIYISENLEDVPEKFKGIGIRIEDDVLVTNGGNKVLTYGTPKTIDEIEAFS
ncbi:MAG: aminopeptidase P N-terminal domain-containing protein [Candidatus Melainabacteria bacterium]|nr:aminopeptidase P N-terminal domain-containing protein [Candidatus Melainabacteria bacterium]